MNHPIPADALDDRLGYFGTAGSGKTYNAGSGVERLLRRGDRCIIPDPLGVWWGLRLSADGKAQSDFDVAIFGGPHGDLPLNEHVGSLIGETVAGMKESCILDLSELGTKGAERRFMLAFLTTLYKHTNGEPVHVVFDEADMWAPQKILDREDNAAKLLGMMETIVRRGRVKGFIPWLISQRPAVLSKDVLSQVDGLIAFKLTSSQDRDALGDWVKGQADIGQWNEIWKSLPTLERGQGVVWLPARGTLKTALFPEKVTFDSSRTPRRGEKIKRQAKLKPLNLDKLRERMSTVEAEAKANDPKELRTKISDLQRQLAGKPAGASKDELDAAHALGVLDAETSLRKAHTAIVLGCTKELRDRINNLRADAEQALDFCDRVVERVVNLIGTVDTIRTARPHPPVPFNRIIPPGDLAKAMPNAEVPPTVRKILDVIHRSHPVALTFEAAAARAAVSRRSSAYNSYRKFIEVSDELVKRNDGRFASAPGFSAPVGPGADPIAEFSSKLPPSYAKMLQAIAANGRALTEHEIAEASGVSPTSSGLSGGLSELQKLGLIERVGERGSYTYSIHSDLR